jgi:CubicO group peptidase (beta-lactamase class C family)
MRHLQLGMTALALILTGFLLARFVGREPKAVTVQLTPQPSQPRVAPAEAGIDPVALDAAAAFAAKHDSRALIVGWNGHIVYEKYWDGATFDEPVETGFEPVLVALAVGTALNDRLLHGLDEPLANYLPDLGEPAKDFTSRQLLAGDHAEIPVEHSADLLALLLERVTRQPYQALLAQRLWTPLGGGTLEFHQAKSPLRAGGVDAGCCIRARAGDWMRVAELMLNGGVYEGNELAPRRYVELMMRPAHKEAPRGYFTRVDGSFADKVVWLEGTHQQRLWIVPSLRLTILRIGGDAGKGWDEAMIPDSIIRGTRGWRPSAPGQGTDPKKFAPH